MESRELGATRGGGRECPGDEAPFFVCRGIDITSVAGESRGYCTATDRHWIRIIVVSLWALRQAVLCVRGKESESGGARCAAAPRASSGKKEARTGKVEYFGLLKNGNQLLLCGELSEWNRRVGMNALWLVTFCCSLLAL